MLLYFYIFSTANHDDHLSQPEEHHRDQWRGTAVDRPSPRWLTTTLTVTASTPASEILLIQPSRPSMTANPCRYFKAHIFLFLSLFKNFKLANPGLFFCIFDTVDSRHSIHNFLLMAGFEPRTSGVESDRSTN